MLSFLPPPAKTYCVTALSKLVWPGDAAHPQIRSNSFLKAARDLNIEVVDTGPGCVVNEDGAAAFLVLVPDIQRRFMFGNQRERAMVSGMRIGLGIEDGNIDKELFNLAEVHWKLSVRRWHTASGGRVFDSGCPLQDTSIPVEEYNRLVIARFQQMRVEGGVVEEIVSASESDGGTPSWANMRGRVTNRLNCTVFLQGFVLATKTPDTLVSYAGHA